MASLPDIAVIADAHLHDIYSDYECAGTSINGEQLTLRSWKDTRRSSRVFNESKDALETALNDIRHRGIRHVVLLGDYTDDGQIESTRRFAKLIHQYQQQYDMAFYAIPGNHDFYGPAGKHQSTRFVTTPGNSVLVTSDPEVASTEHASVLTQNMYCEGALASLLPMAAFGLFKQPEYVYWESPFGQSDAPESRMFNAQSEDGSVSHSLMDSSYLVEPSDGLWLLMIDANVFEPRNGRSDATRKSTFFDSSDAGWNSVLRVKPFLIDWIKNVCTRAEQSGKHLLAFSHYPMINTIDNETSAETLLFGQNEITRRTPNAKVAETLLATGLNLHFSGHMHVNNEAQIYTEKQTLTNISVPSLVAFPAAYKLIHPALQTTRVTTIPIDAMPLNTKLIAAYRAENQAADNTDESALDAVSYGDFLYKKTYTRLKHRYLEREWPPDIACQIENTTAADLAIFMLINKGNIKAQHFGPMRPMLTPALESKLDAMATPYQLSRKDFDRCSMMTLLADWYCLRQAGSLAGAYVAAEKRRLYACITTTLSGPEPEVIKTHTEFFGVFLSVFNRALQRLSASDVADVSRDITTISRVD